MRDTIICHPTQYRDMIIEAVRAGLIDRWEGWRRLYNLGWRGRDLAAVATVSIAHA